MNSSSRDGRDGADGLVSNAQKRSEHSEAQADKLLGASVPYELQRGGIYLVEVKQGAMGKGEATLITRYYQDRYQIDIQFVFTAGQKFGLQAVPPLEADDSVTTAASADTKPERT